MANLQGRLFTLHPFLDIEDNTSAFPSPPVPSEQPVAIWLLYLENQAKRSDQRQSFLLGDLII